MNQGNALARQGQFGEAAASYVRALALDPGFAIAHNNLGNVLLELKRRDEALESYRRAIVLKPDYAEAHDNAGHALLELGRLADAAACFRRAIACDPRLAGAHDHLGRALQAAGQCEEALASYRRAIEIEPGFDAAYNDMGNALLDLGRFEEARLAYQTALKINPDSAEAHNNLGSLNRSCGRLDEAMQCFGRALALRPVFAEAHSNMGLAHRLKSSPREAQASCLRALELDPKLAPALTTLAETHADLGDFAGAERLLRQVIEIDANSPEAWAGLSRLRKMTRQDSGWLAEAQRIARLPLPPRRQALVRYALGKYFDDTAEFDAAFANYQRANELKKLCRPPHDPRVMTQAVQRSIDEQDRDWLARSRRRSNESDRPVFVVGMLRSGTTLAEQILASHPDVFGAGEVPFWSGAGAAARCAAGELPEERRTQGLAIEGLANEYLRILQSLAPPRAARVVDKMPANFLTLGLIHAALPNARIIHMRRDPVDTCLSIYFQHFETALSYTNDLEDLARYYEEYRRLMNHWRATLPWQAILEVPYEGLVREREQWSRRMLDHIGLPWDERCMDFHRTDRTVITASRWQVRQPVSAASVARWRNYERHLGPLARLHA